MSKDKRKAPRLSSVLPVKLQKDKKGFIAALGNDISMLGIGMESAEKFAVGSELLFEIFLSNGKKVKLKGKVMWDLLKDERYYYGVKFSKINLVNKFKLFSFVRLVKKI